jgi:hypothetical protein
VRDRADDRHARAAREGVAEGAVSDEGQTTLAAAFERARNAEDVLTLGQPADADEPCALRLPAERRPRLVRRPRRESHEVDPAVDHLHAPSCLRHDCLQPRSQPLGDGHDAGGAADGEPGRSTNRARALRVRHVLPVRREDDGGAAREGSEQPRGDEEVRVDDVRPEAPRCGRDVVRERQMARLAAAAVDDRARQLVPPRGEACLELGDEGAEVGCLRPGVHLRDEEDAHGVRHRISQG